MNHAAESGFWIGIFIGIAIAVTAIFVGESSHKATATPEASPWVTTKFLNKGETAPWPIRFEEPHPGLSYFIAWSDGEMICGRDLLLTYTQIASWSRERVNCYFRERDNLAGGTTWDRPRIGIGEGRPKIVTDKQGRVVCAPTLTGTLDGTTLDRAP